MGEIEIWAFVVFGIAFALLIFKSKGGSNDDLIPDKLSKLSATAADEQLTNVDNLLAYGEYEKAAKHLSTAVRRSPHQGQLKYKLLEVYFIWGRADQFKSALVEYDAELRETEYWNRVMTMHSAMFPEDSQHLDSA